MKGNIVLIVLFILIASSLFGVMMAQQARNLIHATQSISNYYHAYYTAFAGIQQGLTQQVLHGYGYEDTILNSTDIQFQAHINSRTNQIGYKGSGCINGYQLSGGDSLIIPLFFDESKGFDPINYSTISSSLFSNEYKPHVTILSSGTGEIIVKIVDEALKNYNVQQNIPLQSEMQEITLHNLNYDSSDSKNKNYLLIANPSKETVGVCLGTDLKIVSTYVNISSLGNYRESSVQLYAKKKYQLPGFLAYGTIQ